MLKNIIDTCKIHPRRWVVEISERSSTNGSGMGTVRVGVASYYPRGGNAGYFADGHLLGGSEGLVADEGVVAETCGVCHVGEVAVDANDGVFVFIGACCLSDGDLVYEYYGK